MAITKLSSREFNQDTSRAKRAARRGPVFITHRGHLSHVLLSAEEYQRTTARKKSIVDLLAMPAAGEIEFDPVISGSRRSLRRRRNAREESRGEGTGMYLLDSNVVSELQKGKNANPRVRV